MQRDDAPTLTSKEGFKPLTLETEKLWREECEADPGLADFGGWAMLRIFATLDASRARVRELEADLEAISGALDGALVPDGPVAERVRALAERRQELLLEIVRQQSALARYRAQAKGDGGWLPIESAPHGVEVLLYTPPFACMGASARHEMRVGCASWGDVVNGISNRGYDGHATHWRPLPPPPASEQEGR